MVSSCKTVIVLDGVSLTCHVERRRVKNARLEVKPWGLLVILPVYGVNPLRLIEENKNWILKVYRRLKESEVLYQSPGNMFPLLGVQYTVILDEEVNGFKIDEVHRLIRIGFNFNLSDFKNFLKKTLLDLILLFLNSLPAEIDKQYNRITVKAQRTRWASCSVKRNLNFNIKMVSLPINLIEFIVYHELLHFKIKSHSKSFYRLLASRYPDYKRIRKILGEYFTMFNMNKLWQLICQRHFSKQTISSRLFRLVGLGSTSG